jgi:hypothetical protein
MEDRDYNEFSWHTLFFVTGFSFILFNLAIKVLDGSHSALLLWIGTVSLSLGAITWLIKLALKPPPRKKRKLTS